MIRKQEIAVVRFVDLPMPVREYVGDRLEFGLKWVLAPKVMQDAASWQSKVGPRFVVSKPMLDLLMDYLMEQFCITEAGRPMPFLRGVGLKGDEHPEVWDPKMVEHLGGLISLPNPGGFQGVVVPKGSAGPDNIMAGSAD